MLIPLKVATREQAIVVHLGRSVKNPPFSHVCHTIETNVLVETFKFSNESPVSPGTGVTYRWQDDQV